MQPDAPRTFLFGQTPGHERDGIEELRMPDFACIANLHELNAEVILVKFHAKFLPETSEGTVGCKMICQATLPAISRRWQVAIMSSKRWPSRVMMLNLPVEESMHAKKAKEVV